MSMDSKEIKPCPFCGGKPELQKPFNSTYKYVACQSCMAQGPKSVNEEYAIEWWTRWPHNQPNTNKDGIMEWISINTKRPKLGKKCYCYYIMERFD